MVCVLRKKQMEDGLNLRRYLEIVKSVREKSYTVAMYDIIQLFIHFFFFVSLGTQDYLLHR